MPDENDPDLETTHQTPVGDSPEVVAGRYRILRTLGRGGGGIVWLAHDEHLGREVALKKVAGETDAEVLVTRGLREARTSAALAHHHVVRVYDAFVHDGSPWIVMEYVPGPSLSALLERGRSLPIRQVARIGAQVATALAAAHSAGVVHRDVKPGNVLLADESGQDAKLTDFGIARAEDDHQLTRTGMVSGTAAYFSPELARGENPSAASDVWALGATLYAAVEGRRPYPDAGNPVAQLHLIARQAPDAPQRAGTLEPVLRGMLDPDPAARWTADRAARALTEVAEGRHAEGAGATAAGAAGAGAWAAGRHPGEATQALRPADATRQVPLGPAGTGGHARADRQDHDHAYAARPHHAQGTGGTAYPGPAGPIQPPAPQRGGRRGHRRGTVVLSWLVGVPLALLLGWLVWTIASGDQPPWSDGRPTTTATQGQPVSTEEAEATVRAFYTTLEDEGLEAARRYLADGVPVDGAIADGLDSVEVSDPSSTERDGGVVETVVTATYSYGPVQVVQEETLQVARRGTEPLVVQRVTRTLSGGGGDQGGADGDDAEGDGGQNPADESNNEGGGDGNEGGGDGNEGGGNGNEGGGNGNEGGGNGGPGNGSQGRDG